MNDADARKYLALPGLRIVWELRGIPSIAIEEMTPAKKGIMSSRSFGRPVTSLDDLLEAAGSYTAAAVRRLRSQNSVCRLVDVWLTTNTFNPDEPQYSAGTVVAMEEPTDYLPDLAAAARRGLSKIFRDGYRYRKVAVFLSRIESRDGRQTDLFLRADPRKEALKEAVGRITARYGHESIGCAASCPTGAWEMKREKLSPGYSTRWEEIPTAKIR